MSAEAAAGPVVVVGAGQAGGRLAEALRQNGFAGPVTVVGEEEHPPYERPSLSKEFLREPGPERITWIRPLPWWEDNGVALRPGRRAVSVDRAACRVALDDGTTLPYGTLVLATGTCPRLLAVEGAAHPAVHSLRTIADAERLRGSIRPGGVVLVIGAGFIGLEVAAVAHTLGARVVVAETAFLPMGRAAPPAVGEFYAGFHRGKGVDLRLGTGVRRIDDAAGRAVAQLTDGTTVMADAVVAGIGVVPNDHLAAEAGLATGNGIVVDEFGRTADPSVYAAGDVTSHFNPLLGRHIRLESWQNAQNQAVAVARNIAGIQTSYAEVPWFWSDQFELNLQIAGIPEAGEVVQRGTLGAGPATMFHLHDAKLVAVVGVNSPRDVRAGKTIIAAGVRVTAAELADPAFDLARLARTLRQPALTA